MITAKKTGNWGEEQAMAFLRQNGYTVLDSNWRHGHLEIDIVAQHARQIVFVEVKTRTGNDYGEPEGSVSLAKQRFLIRAANQYIAEKNIDLEARFDVISILVQNGKTILKHLPDAFYPIVK